MSCIHLLTLVSCQSLCFVEFLSGFVGYDWDNVLLSFNEIRFIQIIGDVFFVKEKRLSIDTLLTCWVCYGRLWACLFVNSGYISHNFLWSIFLHPMPTNILYSDPKVVILIKIWLFIAALIEDILWFFRFFKYFNLYSSKSSYCNVFLLSLFITRSSVFLASNLVLSFYWLLISFFLLLKLPSFSYLLVLFFTFILDFNLTFLLLPILFTIFLSHFQVCSSLILFAFQSNSFAFKCSTFNHKTRSPTFSVIVFVIFYLFLYLYWRSSRCFCSFVWPFRHFFRSEWSLPFLD